MGKLNKSSLRKIVQEEYQKMLNEQALETGPGIPKTIYVVTEPARFDPDDPIDQMIDPGAPEAGGRGYDLGVIEDLMVQTHDFDIFLQSLANRGNEFAKKILGVFADKSEAVEYAVDVYDKRRMR